MVFRPRMGELERAVMEHLWGAAPAWSSVRDVHAALSGEREIAYTTVMTVLDRLAKKSLVRRRKEGRAHVYAAVSSRGAMTADVMREALAEFGEQDRRTALVAFVGEASEEERAALREALAELENR
ncbi:BlaI/MecI/CopY family transcriptional regulator [Nocardioides caldifontis]|uniref:BlaI/MecI/CopY family transcriptional regulator n=1 Tax=Nocardioides caldifontis TaxID=2588938 RepID=UPI0011DF26D8|nr:BlaI/MecI/CopY family transcriptional regulator [Nocardioides caldifontis]